MTSSPIDSRQDYAVIATTDDGRTKVMAGRTTNLAEEARRRHDASPTAAAALGRTLTGAALLGMTLKDTGTVTLRLIGDGPVGGVIAEADAAGNVRGYARDPSADLPPTPAGKLDVGGLIGRHGFCYVTRDMGLKEPYTGMSPLASGEVGEDLTRYLFESEQTPSAVALGVLVGPPGRVRAAGGLFVQLMPEPEPGGAPDDAAGKLRPAGTDSAAADLAGVDLAGSLEARVGNITSVSRLIEQGLRPEDLVRRILADVPHTIHEARSLRFVCRCSRERAFGSIAALKRADLEEIIADAKGAELVCRFCGEAYRFTPQELSELRPGTKPQ